MQRVQAMLDAFSARDVDTLSSLLTADVEIFPIRAALEGTVYSGPEAAGRWIAAVDQSWANMTVHSEQIRQAGDRVLVLGRVRGAGRGSGAAIDVEAASLVEFRDGLICSIRITTDVAAALRSAELR